MREALTQVEADQIRHDCEEPLLGDWRTLGMLLPAIDRHGWLADSKPMTLRAVSAAIAVRLRPGDLPPVWDGVIRRVVAGRFRDAELPELAAAYDEVNARLDELLATSFEVARVRRGSLVRSG